jgi:AraC family transcriptional activator of pobA
MRASDVVRARHLQEAKRLLLFTALTVNQVALIAGYPDPAHFARSFRAQTGLTPRAWREARMAG